MANKIIYVNKEYEKAFESICKLIKGGCFEGLGWKVIDDVIDDGVYEYQLTTRFTDEAKVEKHGFKKDGATWFKGLRGQVVENNSAIWTSFIETASAAYHKRYSVVEYQQQPKTRAEREKALEDNKLVTDEFIRIFYPEYYQKTDLVEVDADGSKEDIYGVAMRIELSGGTGASLPILCKIYFSKSDRNVVPIYSHISETIDNNLAEIIPEDTNDNQTISGEGVINTTLNAMDKLINNNDINFADYICYSDESDKLAVENLLAQLSHDAIELECQRVDILYISHITASSFLYNVNYRGKPLFRLSSGINKALTFSCLNCASNEMLVESNMISYEVDGQAKSVTLELNLPNFGLSKEQIDEIKENSTLKDHYIHVSCPLSHRGQECKSIKCKTKLFDADGKGTLYKCKDCPYPEIVYTAVNGEKKYTPALVFAKDIMTLVDKNSETIEVEKCESCGRFFTKNALKKKLCPICDKANKGLGDDQNKQLYKEYKGLLPLSVRAFSIFNKKFCFEDNELIIFLLGKKKYLFNKLSVKEKGCIEKPRKML